MPTPIPTPTPTFVLFDRPPLTGGESSEDGIGETALDGELSDGDSEVSEPRDGAEAEERDCTSLQSCASASLPSPEHSKEPCSVILTLPADW